MSEFDEVYDEALGRFRAAFAARDGLEAELALSDMKLAVAGRAAELDRLEALGWSDEC